MKEVAIHVDTSIKGPKRRDGAFLYVISFRASNGKTADKWKIDRKEDTTENEMTLMGLEAALKSLTEPCRLVLYLECPHVAAVLENRWYVQWRYNGWMTAKNEPVSYVEKWKSIEYLLNAHDFEVKLKQEHTYRGWMRRELEKEQEKRKA